mgnify:CR=1 FL=1
MKQIEAFADPETGLIRGVSEEHGRGVALRLEWAELVEEETIEHPAWVDAVAAIGDEGVCPKYRGLLIKPQLGLVPIGRDPDSGLYEFAHPEPGAVPERDPDGKLGLPEETGPGFVLIPGGRFTMGAQSESEEAPNYDPEAKKDESPVHEVSLSPFFLAKYEMTQAQWERFTGRRPSSWRPDSYKGVTMFHPVETVSWDRCTEVLRRMGLTLPSEAQWEYAARAGTTTPWSTGDDRMSLLGHANLSDTTAKAGGATWTTDLPEEFVDGHVVHAPVDDYQPNVLGLYNMHGNSDEWDADTQDDGFYAPGPRKDPRCETPSIHRIMRGAGFQGPASNARSAARRWAEHTFIVHYLGLRPARELVR